MLVIVALASFALSLLANFQDPWINTDGSLYLRLAESLSQGANWDELDYGQPFYSWLVAGVAQLTTLSFKHAAWLINAAFCSALAVYFVRLCLCLRPGRDMAVIAALVILFYPPLNEYRGYVVRDFGFWAFAVVGLYHLARAHVQRSPVHHGLAVLVFAISALFRFEGVLLVALPALFVIMQRGGGWKIWLTVALAGLGAVALLYQIPVLAAVADAYAEHIADSLSDYGALVTFYSEEVTRGYMEDYAALGLLLSLVAIFAAALIEKFSIVYLLGLAWLAYAMRLSFRDPRLQPLWMFAGWVFAFTVAYFLFTRLLQGRHFILIYLPILALLAVLWQDRLTAAGRRLMDMSGWKKLGIAVVLLLLFVDSFISFGADQAHVERAVAWSRAQVAAGEPLLVNEPALAYELVGSKNWQHIEDIRRQPALVGEYMDQYDALVLYISRKNSEWQTLAASLDGGPWDTARFENNKGDAIVVMSRRPE